MARLTLNPMYSLENLGEQMLFAASSEYAGATNEKGDAEGKIKEMFADNGSFKPGNPEIKFYYDTATKVHVVVPYIGNKVVQKASVQPEIDFSQLAAEAMGFIVIFGCGK